VETPAAQRFLHFANRFQKPGIAKFPVNFPVSRELQAETGSHLTAPTTSSIPAGHNVMAKSDVQHVCLLTQRTFRSFHLASDSCNGVLALECARNCLASAGFRRNSCPHDLKALRSCRPPSVAGVVDEPRCLKLAKSLLDSLIFLFIRRCACHVRPREVVS
jgi:hypothetical protein